MPRLTVLIHSVVGIALAFAATAQAGASLPSEGRCVHEWPEAASVGELRPVAARYCRLESDAAIDAVVMRAHILGYGEVSRAVFLLSDVARAHACIPLGAALDFAVLPVGPTAEAVLVLGSDGALRLWRWLPGQSAPQSQWIGSWPGYRRLAAIRNGASTELFGFDAGGVRVRRATWSAGQLGVATLEVVPPNVLSIEAMDWDRDGNLDLLFGTATGVFVNRWNMTPIAGLPWSIPTGVPITLSTSVSRSAAAGDLLVTIAGNGTQTTVAWANATTSGSLNLGPYTIGPVARFDREGDGDEDLLLGDALHSVVHVLLREPGGFLVANEPLIVGPGAPDAGLGAVCGGDVDGDGDGDVSGLNVGMMNVHAFLDASITSFRVSDVRADLAAAAAGSGLDIPVTVTLPAALPAMASGATSVQLHFDGWFTDLATGRVLPLRAVNQDVPIGPAQAAVTTSIEFALPAPPSGSFHLQLHAAVVAVQPDGSRRCFPSQLLHLTTDPQLEAQIRMQVSIETTGSPSGGPGDGGGDGNILGTKTGKHEIGVPPQ